MVMYCTVCPNNTHKYRNISYFNYPKDDNKRLEWLKAVGREDLLQKLNDSKTRQQYRICEHHFERDCIMFSKNRNVKYLFEYAFPTLKLPSSEGAGSSSKENLPMVFTYTPSNTDVNLIRHAQSASDDSDSQIPDLPVTVKIEVEEEDISEHEEDIMEKLENRKRMQEEDPIAADAKKVRVELIPVADTQLERPQYQVIVQPQQSQYVGVLQPPLQQKIAPKPTQPPTQQQPDPSEPAVVPEFFMNVVVRNQNEILSILKRQVLLQDPDPELLTFLRFLGSKLLRLPKKKRDELQDKITEMLYKE